MLLTSHLVRARKGFGKTIIIATTDNISIITHGIDSSLFCFHLSQYLLVAADYFRRKVTETGRPVPFVDVDVHRICIRSMSQCAV